MMRAFSISFNTLSQRALRFVKRRPLLKLSVGGSGLVVGQLAYMQSTYVPLNPPIDDVITGTAVWNELKSSSVKHVSQTNQNLDGESSRPKKRVLIIGDSLVVGIGCKEASVLPQVLCQKLSEQLKADISWYTHGINGADIRTLHSDILQRFREHQPQLFRLLTKVVPDIERRHSAVPPRPCISHMIEEADVVVIMCGLNDFKRLLLGRTVSVFRRDLDDLLRLLRERMPSDCLVVLPALPMELTRLPQPLKSVAVWLAGAFDAAKRDAAYADACAHFIPKPSLDLWHRAEHAAAAADPAESAAGGAAAVDQQQAEGGAAAAAPGLRGLLLAGDGVHPNEAGYAAFAEYLSHELAAFLRRAPAAAHQSAPALAATV